MKISLFNLQSRLIIMIIIIIIIIINVRPNMLLLQKDCIYELVSNFLHILVYNEMLADYYKNTL